MNFFYSKKKAESVPNFIEFSKLINKENFNANDFRNILNLLFENDNLVSLNYKVDKLKFFNIINDISFSSDEICTILKISKDDTRRRTKDLEFYFDLMIFKFNTKDESIEYNSIQDFLKINKKPRVNLFIVPKDINPFLYVLDFFTSLILEFPNINDENLNEIFLKGKTKNLSKSIFEKVLDYFYKLFIQNTKKNNEFKDFIDYVKYFYGKNINDAKIKNYKYSINNTLEDESDTDNESETVSNNNNNISTEKNNEEDILQNNFTEILDQNNSENLQVESNLIIEDNINNFPDNSDEINEEEQVIIENDNQSNELNDNLVNNLDDIPIIQENSNIGNLNEFNDNNNDDRFVIFNKLEDKIKKLRKKSLINKPRVYRDRFGKKRIKSNKFSSSKQNRVYNSKGDLIYSCQLNGSRCFGINNYFDNEIRCKRICVVGYEYCFKHLKYIGLQIIRKNLYTTVSREKNDLIGFFNREMINFNKIKSLYNGKPLKYFDSPIGYSKDNKPIWLIESCRRCVLSFIRLSKNQNECNVSLFKDNEINDTEPNCIKTIKPLNSNTELVLFNNNYDKTFRIVTSFAYFI